MKARGQIMSMEAVPETARLCITIEGSGKQHTGGQERQVVVKATITADRATFKDYAIGDFFEITVEASKS